MAFMFSLDKTYNFYFYKDCMDLVPSDWLQSKDYKYDYKEEENFKQKQVEEIKENYKPFVEIKKETLQYFLR